MFKQRRQRQQHQPQNPISDMEQFYLNQYFRSQPSNHAPHPPSQPYPHQTNDRFPPIEFARLHQLELRVTQIEQYLGLTTAKPSAESPIREFVTK